MRTLTYLVASSIDGYITGPDGGDPTGSIFAVDGDHMQPLLEAFPEVVPTHVREQLNFHPENKNFDTVLEGRNSYQIGLDFGVTNAYRHLEHYVFSTTMTEAPDPDVHLVRTDPVATVRELKQRDGMGIWLCGGGKLAYTLRHEIDELVIKLNPVALGSGIPLFDGPFDKLGFTLAGTRSFGSGLVLLTYRRA
ncbi:MULTISPECIES: dihydrofolate reductase family protein [Thermocrispum]|uniref:Deaminase n=1 Tax=Thermocrispum agreste TaxID=37925 RepID=A0A2W4JMV5_9PSEU|nr:MULTISPECIES: dihydrofolate reductase family protein [Thermocrispum]PZN00363.1 MAG: deaminase [Thermocrispum agreste]